MTELEERLNLAREDLLERELVLEELKGVVSKLQVELHGHDEQTTGTAAASLAKQVNDLQSKIKESTRKLMALVSEMSIYQATAIKLAEEAVQAEKSVEQGQKNLAQGLPPSLAAEQKWSQFERQMALPARGAGAGALDLEGPRTTAVVRPNAYVPENSITGLPKPYGGQFLPFKPSEPGANMRHVRNPEAKPVEV